jgi:hypothetical protein
MRATKWVVTAAVLVCSAASASTALEMEAGGGVFGHADTSPTFTGRVGVDFWNHLTPSVRLMTLSPLDSGRSAWAVLGEIRAHSNGRWQVNAGLSLGLGTATFAGGTDHQALSANVYSVAPYVLGDVGLRLMLGRFWVGLNVGGSPMPDNQYWMGTLSVGFRAFGE